MQIKYARDGQQEDEVRQSVEQRCGRSGAHSVKRVCQPALPHANAAKLTYPLAQRIARNSKIKFGDVTRMGML